MKKISILILVLALALSNFIVASATAPAPGGPFASAFYIQNVSATDANCLFTFYNAAGDAVYTSAGFVVGGNSNYEVFTPNITGLNSGSYSGVVSCDQPVQAIVNFSDADSAGSHSAVSQPSAAWYIPNLYDNYYSYYSNVYVQNATGSPINITLDVYGPDPANPANIIKVYTTTQSNVPGFASAIFDQAGLAELATNKGYSGKVTATGDVATIVNIYGGPSNVQLYSYNAFSNGALKAYVPALYSKYYNFNTELKVQNVGTGDANVTITYSTGLTANITLKPNTGQAFYTPNILPNANKVYTALVESTNSQPIVVVVNESDVSNKAATYDGLIDGATKVSIPLVMKDYYGYDTDVNCMNVGSGSTNVTITYSIVGDPTPYSTTKSSIAAGTNAQFYTVADPALAAVVTKNKKISATVTSTGQNVNCIVNESHRTLPGDTLYSYNAIPVIP